MSGGSQSPSWFQATPGAGVDTQAINSVLGTNIGGQGGMSNNYSTKLGNSLTGYNLFNAGGLNGPIGGSGGESGPASLPYFNIQPQFFDPNSFAPRDLGKGAFNHMAAALAGPVYMPKPMPMMKKPGNGKNGVGGVSHEHLGPGAIGGMSIADFIRSLPGNSMSNNPIPDYMGYTL